MSPELLNFIGQLSLGTAGWLLLIVVVSKFALPLWNEYKEYLKSEVKELKADLEEAEAEKTKS